MKFFAAFLTSILLTPFFAIAATDNFTIRTLVGADTIPPTDVTGLSAVAVSTSQIDISWNASSDNLGVDGYKIFRDSIQIATSTLINYSDTGLLPSTSYSYEVVAFDADGNLSGTSTPAVAITHNVVVSSTNDGPQVTRVKDKPIEIFDWKIETTRTQITITFSTSDYVRSTIRWGRTSSHEIGYSDSNVLKKEHVLRITDLSPGTLYELGLTLAGRSGSEINNRLFQIRTDTGVDVTAPANVTNLRAVLDNNKVKLTWDNPLDSDFSNVRIVRNDNFYPTDVADGWIMYEGRQTSVEDVLDGQSNRYYTVFSLDESGNISSGAVVHVGSLPVVDVVAIPDDAVKILDYKDILFIQGGELIAMNDIGSVELSTVVPTTIAIPYNSVPEHLKSIIVTLIHPNDPELIFSFLLRVNSDMTFYEATIGALGDSGIYGVQVDVYDFKTKQMLRVKGDITLLQTNRDTVKENSTVLWPPVLLLFMAFILGIFVFRRGS